MVQYIATAPMPYDARRSTTPTKVSWPSSTPRLNNDRAVESHFPAGRPSAGRSRISSVEQAEGERDDPGRALGQSPVGTWTKPSAAAASVMLCATVNVVTLATSSTCRSLRV
jgi:hypothetical protein